MFVDWASNSNAFKAEIFFVGAREFPNCRFGGRLDEVQDPQTGLIVTLRAFGEYALRVVDPAKLILNLVGTVDVTNNDAVTAWVTQQLLKCTRSGVTSQLMSGAWQILGLSMHRAEIEHGTLEEANTELADYGIAVTRLGNLDINLDDDDNARLKKLAGDTAYSRLAGSFTAAAQAEMMQGAGQGMAQGGASGQPGLPRRRPRHGPDDGPAAAGAGLSAAARTRIRRRRPGVRAPGPAGRAAAGTAPAGAPRHPRQAGTVAVRQLPGRVREGAKFCDSCGNPMSKQCANCNAAMSATSKFCAECGTPTSPPQA